MLREFRYLCLSLRGKSVQGIVLASNRFKAKKLIERITDKHKLKVISILQKKNFLYKVRDKTGKKVKGKQLAFSKQEVRDALTKMGYQDAKIQPALLDFKRKPPYSNILMFVQLSSFLLKEKMSYDKILRMLAEDETNPTLKETLKKIESELRKGKSGTEVFSRYTDVFGRFPAYMLGLATKSGNMAEVYESTALFMQRTADYRKSLRKAFMSPVLTVIFVIAACLYYIISIFPATANMFSKYGMEVPPMTAATLSMSNFIGANFWWILFIFAIPIICIIAWWRTPNGKVWRDKFLIRLPVIGHLLHKTSIEIFFRVFSAIYTGAENNIETLRASASACQNAYIEKNINKITIPRMLKEGMSLVPALEIAGVFNTMTLNRLRTGAEVGNILQAAKQISLFYEKETQTKMEGLIASIQGFIGVFIAIVIVLLTVVSMEVAFVSPPTPGVTGM